MNKDKSQLMANLISAYAMSVSSDMVHKGVEDLPKGFVGSTNKYDPNQCSNSKAKARRLKQMKFNNSEERV